MKIAVVHNRDASQVIAAFGQPCPETYAEKTVAAVLAALDAAGHETALFEGDPTLIERLRAFMPPVEGRPGGIVFNMAYGIQGESRYCHVPAMLEMAGVPYTGSGVLGHAVSLDKVVAKRLLLNAGVLTPRYAVMRPNDAVPLLRYPLIVKPRHESTSFGIAIARDAAELRAAVAQVCAAYRQDALVEEYVEGREFCVGLLGEAPEALPVVEQDFGARELRLVTFDDKYRRSDVQPEKICPAAIAPDLQQALIAAALRTFATCECRDYARVDVRVDARGDVWVLEINSMASLGAAGSFLLAAETAGYSFGTVVERMVQLAARRAWETVAV